mmetsp:Transcript_27221/g.41709  ORF Transcript_27221/g.41709 Transcript_27221/m.41709 type:complete len:1354 (+) Transcript_27221:293-4354(+)
MTDIGPDETFQSKDLCGIKLKSLVSEGHLLIAKVLQASNEIPACFRYDYILQEQETAKILLTDEDDDHDEANSGIKFSLAKAWSKMTSRGSSHDGSENKKILFRQPPSYCGFPSPCGDKDFGIDNRMDRCKSDKKVHSLDKDRDQVDTNVRSNDKNSESPNSLDEDAGRYKSILVDFKYLANPALYDGHENVFEDDQSSSHKKKFDRDHEAESRKKYISEQENLESEFISCHESTLVRFHRLFSEINAFAHEINSFARDLDSGHYVQHSIESLLTLSSGDGNVKIEVGRQFLCEILYLYANALILLDLYIPGTIRERLIIAHHRYCSGNSSNSSLSIAPEVSAPRSTMLTMSSNFDQLCKLFQRTGLEEETRDRTTNCGQSTHANEKKCLIQDGLLSRVALLPSYVQNVVQCLMHQDIYPAKSSAFPSLQRNCRSSQLAPQASMFVVILYFDPTMLKSDDIMMRNAIERFSFMDNWRLPLYNGQIVDLTVEWNGRFLSAQNALQSLLSNDRVIILERENTRSIQECSEKLKSCLTQNKITDVYLLEHDAMLLDYMRETNIALRWRILHNGSPLLPQREITVHSNREKSKVQYSIEERVVNLFLLSSQYEALLKDVFQQILDRREGMWENMKILASAKMHQISNHYAGNDCLTLVEKNDALCHWFSRMKDEIDALAFDSEDCFSTSRDIQFCVNSVSEMRLLDIIDRNIHVKGIIAETITRLKRMVKISSINKNVSTIIDAISECTYARSSIEYFLPIFHLKSTKDPKSVSLLRNSFLKMATFLSNISSRIDTGLEGHIFAKEFHTHALLYFVKEILDVIPKSIFSSFGRIADKQNKSLMRLPSKIESEKLGDYALLDDRYNLAKLTYELSVLTKGIIEMEKIDSLKMNPRRLLEEGLRKELVRQISHAFHVNLQFKLENHAWRKLGRTSESFLSCFHELDSRMQRFKCAIIWLQDFLGGIDGLEIFFQESSRVVWHSVNKELDEHTLRLSICYRSYLLEGVLIPNYPRTQNDPNSATFMGRIVNALMTLIDPKYCSYSRLLGAWSSTDGDAICDAKVISLVRRAIGVQGLAALDALLCQNIHNELQSLFKFYNNSTVTYGVTLEKFRDGIFPEWKVPKRGIYFYDSAISKVDKLMVPILTCLCRIGQLQLLRTMVQSELKIGSRIEAPQLVYQNKIENQKMLIFLKKDVKRKTCRSNRGLDTLNQVAAVNRTLGAVDPMSTVFMKTDPLEGFPSLLALFVIKYMKRVSFDTRLGVIKGRDDESFDGWSIVTGMATSLRQFHTSYTKATFALLGQYVKCAAQANINNPDRVMISDDVRHVLIFMRQLRAIANLDHSILYDHVPLYVMELYDHML